MAQTRLRDYFDPIGSFEHNLCNLGIHLPGRFYGFDKIVSTGPLAFTLQHDGNGTGLRLKNDANDLIGPLGVLMTNQGLICIENTPVPGFAVDSNAGNANIRIDLIIANHQFTNVAGGSPVTYSIIKGPLDAAVANPLATPDFQLIIGRLMIPAGATDLTAATLIKERCPDSGDGLDARLLDVNKFTKQQQFAQSVIPITAPTEIVGGKAYFALKEDGNSYIFNLPTLTLITGLMIGNGFNPDMGAEITLHLNENAVLAPIQFFMPLSQTNKGYSYIAVPEGIENKIATIASTRTPVLQAAPGQLLTVTLIKNYIGGWSVKSVEGLGYSHSLKYGMVVECDLPVIDIPLYFNSDGSGKSMYYGMQACNGLFGTVDRRGRVGMMAGSDADIFVGAADNSTITELTNKGFSVVYRTLDGQVSIALAASHLPRHRHDVLGITGGDNNDNSNKTRFAGGDKNPDESAFWFTGTTEYYGGNLDGTSDNVKIMQPYVATIYMMRIL